MTVLQADCRRARHTFPDSKNLSALADCWSRDHIPAIDAVDPGAKDGKGHFEVTVVSDVFEGYSLLERHRMVYDAFGGLMESDIHALRINAFSPPER